MFGMIIAAIVIGIVAGYLGRLLLPGPDPTGLRRHGRGRHRRLARRLLHLHIGPRDRRQRQVRPRRDHRRRGGHDDRARDLPRRGRRPRQHAQRHPRPHHGVATPNRESGDDGGGLGSPPPTPQCQRRRRREVGWAISASTVFRAEISVVVSATRGAIWCRSPASAAESVSEAWISGASRTERARVAGLPKSSSAPISTVRMHEHPQRMDRRRDWPRGRRRAGARPWTARATRCRRRRAGRTRAIAAPCRAP